MAKLYFRYGTVGSAKTLNLLAVAHNYEQQQKRAFVIKPELDVRFGRELVHSRAGVEKKADLLVSAKTVLDPAAFRGVDCILVDEAQFLAPEVIEQLRVVSQEHGIPVICYGLRTDFRRRLFPGAQRLMELADSIEEIKTTCNFCNRKAIFNLKLQGGVPTLGGPTIDLGAEEKYLPACSSCYTQKLREAGALSL
jgi:thymidine kinase